MGKGPTLQSNKNNRADSNEEEARSKRQQARNQGTEHLRMAGAQSLIQAMKQQNMDRAVIVTAIDPNQGTDAVVEPGANQYKAAGNTAGRTQGGGQADQGVFGLMNNQPQSNNHT